MNSTQIEEMLTGSSAASETVVTETSPFLGLLGEGGPY